MGKIIEANDDNFAEQVKEAGGRVLVAFGAPWCGPCRTLDSVLVDMTSKTPDLTVVKINADQSPGLVGRFGVRSIPSLHIVHDGKMTGAYAAPRTADNIAAWLATTVPAKAIPDTAPPRPVAEADPEQKPARINLRLPYLLFSALQGWGGFMLLSAAATPVATGVAAGIIGYSAFRAVQSVFSSPEKGKQRLTRLLDQLAEHPGQTWRLLPRYAQAATRLAGNAAVFAGGLTLFGAAMAATGGAAMGLGLLSVLMLGKSSLGVIAGLSGLAATAALPRMAEIRAQKKALARGTDDEIRTMSGPDVKGPLPKMLAPGMADDFGVAADKPLPPLVGPVLRRLMDNAPRP